MNCFGLSDVGAKRKTNQDSFRIKDYTKDSCLCVVCDGMGGANGGCEASVLAAEVFCSHVEKVLQAASSSDDVTLTSDIIQRLLSRAAQRANTAVYEKSKANEELDGMGTTLVAALITEDRIFCVNIGDSRMYVLNSDGMIQVTRDHSYVQHLMDEGLLDPQEAANHPNKNIITRAIGTHDFVEADTFVLNKDYDYLLLCSDGLTNFVGADYISDTLTGRGQLPDKVKKLIKAANKNGGGDNITAVAVSFFVNEKENRSI